jgi:hypothetical protein
LLIKLAAVVVVILGTSILVVHLLLGLMFAREVWDFGLLGGKCDIVINIFLFHLLVFSLYIGFRVRALRTFPNIRCFDY